MKLASRSIADFTALSLSAARPAVDKMISELSPRQKEIAARPLEEVAERIDFLLAVGLGYLSLDRSAATLSGGEAQRIRLATQIGSRLRGVLYVLDEPSIGLHARDNERLLGSLERLRNLGNTVLVVEHADPLQSLAAPLTILKYCSAYFFSAWPYYGARLILPRLVLPMVVLMLLPAALLYLREFRPFAVQLILTILYCLGTAFITATGRLSFGISQATVSRYQTVALLFWCCLALLWLGGAFFAPSRMKYLFLVAQLCFLTVFAIGATRAKDQIWIMRGHAFALKTATAALLTGVADPDSLGQAYPEKGMTESCAAI